MEKLKDTEGALNFRALITAKVNEIIDEINLPSAQKDPPPKSKKRTEDKEVT